MDNYTKQINLKEKFNEFPEYYTREINSFLEKYSEKMRINEINELDENYCNSKWVAKYKIPRIDGVIIHKRKYKYSLINRLNSNEFENLLLIMGDEKKIETFEKELFENIGK